MAQKLYVGGIPYGSTDNELKELFSKAGNVTSATIIMDKFSGRSRGFGFVEMASEQEAQKAIDMLNGTPMGDRTIVVNEAREMSERPERPQRSNRSFGDRDRGNRF